MDSLPCNVVLLPSDELAGRATKASKKLAEYGTYFTFETDKFYPHVSLYMLQLKTSDMDTIKEALAAIAAKVAKFDGTATHFRQSKGFFDVEYVKAEQVSALQTEVVKALNPLRDGMRVKDRERMQEAEGEALANYQQYGWESVGSLYRPHMTLTRFVDEETVSVVPAEVQTFSGVFPTLGLFEMGDNGTCVRPIAEFTLL